jgi:hypothetical protein
MYFSQYLDGEHARIAAPASQLATIETCSQWIQSLKKRYFIGFSEASGACIAAASPDHMPEVPHFSGFDSFVTIANL